MLTYRVHCHDCSLDVAFTFDASAIQESVNHSANRHHETGIYTQERDAQGSVIAEW